MRALRVWSALGVLAIGLPLTWACFAQVMRDVDRPLPPGLDWTADRAAETAALALSQFDEASTSAQYAAADRSAREALRGAPMQNTALLVLALDADRQGQARRATALMTALGSRSFRDIQVQLWLGEKALAKRDYAAAFLHLDMALRRDISLSPVVFPVIAGALDDKTAPAALAVRLASRPNWRKSFLFALSEQDPDASRSRRLASALATTAAPPSDAEAGALLAPALNNRDYEEARALWKALLPVHAPEVEALVYDGAFAGKPGAAPFNWRARQGEGWVSEFAQTPEGRPAFHLRYSVSRGQSLTEQLLVLKPGAYRLSGTATVEEGDAPAGLQWRVSCADDQKAILGIVEVGEGGAGEGSFVGTFTVPDVGCPAQQLRLINIPQPSFSTAEVWLQSVRVEMTPPSKLSSRWQVQ